MKLINEELKFYKELVNSLKSFSDALFILASKEGIILDCSSGVEHLLGETKDNILTNIFIEDIFTDFSIDTAIEQLNNKNEYTFESETKYKKFDKMFQTTVIPINCEDDINYIYFINCPLAKSASWNLCGKLLRCIQTTSTILSSSLELEEMLDLILEKLREIVEYDVACLMFLDGYNLNVIASKTDNNELSLPNFIEINKNEELSNYVKQKETKSFSGDTNNNPLIKALGATWVNEFTLVPLVIQDSFFGIMALFNVKKYNYTPEIINIIELFASTSAYSIKNAELGNVFKMQLKILRENVIERTKALELIKVQNQKILEADRMKNEFIAHMSHELRTPLNAIIGFSEALKLKFFGDLTDRQEEYIDDIHASGIHLLGMINDMLDLSKIESKKMDLNLQEFSVELAVNEVINVVLALANKKNINLSEKFNHKNDTIYADHRKFQQVLYNLLSNAIKFTPDEGLIEIISETREHKGHAAIGITVKDYGHGISKDDQEKIFKKFQQLDNAANRGQGGSGLGLTITKELVEMHKGNIELDSDIGKGAAFTFIIPQRCKPYSSKK